MIPDINLLPKVAEQPKKKSNFKTLLLSALVLSMLIFYGINYILVNRDAKDIQKKSDILAAQITEKQTEIDNIIKTPQGKLLTMTEFVEGEKTNVSKIIEVASKYITGSGELAGLDYKGDVVTFTLYFDNLNETSTYVRNLNNESIFKTVELKSASAFTAVDVDNVDDEKDLEGSAQYKAEIQATLDESKLRSGGDEK